MYVKLTFECPVPPMKIFDEATSPCDKQKYLNYTSEMFRKFAENECIIIHLIHIHR